MYQPYPASGQPQPQPSAQPPVSVMNAVKLMYAGAALSAVSLIIALATISSVKSAVEANNLSLTHSQVNAAANFAVGFLVFFGLIGIGLWVWMAQMNRRGRSWARIVATVFFGLDTLFLLLGLIRPHATFSLLISVVIWLVGLGAIILLYRPDATSYIQAMSAPAGYGPPPPGYGGPR